MGRPTKHDEATLTKILDSQCSNPSFEVACARARISEASFWNYRFASLQNDPAYILTYLGIEAQFASHLVRCRDIYMATVENAALLRAERGTRELVFFHGQPSWKLDHRYEGWTDEMLADNLLDNEDRYIHDEVTHARIQNFILHAPPVELVSKALQAYSKRWATQTHVDVDQRVSLGVTVVGGKPKTIDVTPRPAQIEHVGKPTVVSGVFEEIVEDKLSNDVEATRVHPEAVERTSALPSEDKIDRSPTNPVRVQLMAEMENRNRRIEQERAAGKLPPTPPPLPQSRSIDDDIDDVTGTVKAAPPPPTMDDAATQIYAIKKKIHDGVPLGPIERQVKAAIDRGSLADARTLLGIRPGERDGIGPGNPGPGGAAIVSDGRPGSRPGNPVKMV